MLFYSDLFGISARKKIKIVDRNKENAISRQTDGSYIVVLCPQLPQMVWKKMHEPKTS